MKELFPIFDRHPDLIYLDSAATTHKPRSVVDTLYQFYAFENGTVHRAIYRGAMKATEEYNGARETARRFLNAAHFEEIVFTRGTTDAINLVVQSYGRTFLKEGDEVLLSQAEHHSNLVPWQLLAKEKGLVLRFMEVLPDGTLSWKGKITSRTKFVAVTHISNVLGIYNPIREIIEEAHRFGAPVLIDGAQAAPHHPIDVQALDCDFYAFSGHKCYGPTGIGVLYGKKELLEKMPPVQGGGDMIEKVEFSHSTYQEPPLRFEAGTPLIGPAIGLKAALEFLMSLDREKIAQKTKALRFSLEEELLQIPGLKMVGTNRDNKEGIVTFSIEGFHPLDVATILDLKHIAVRSGHLCAQPLLKLFGLDAALRVSLGLYNSESDVRRFLSSIGMCASAVFRNVER